MDTQECVTTKTCSGCGETKPSGEFYAKRSKCKVCELAASRRVYLRNRDAVLARCAQYRDENRDQVKVALAKWYKRNREAVLKKTSAYQKRPDVQKRERVRRAVMYAANRDAIQASRKVFYDSNPDAKNRVNEYHKKHYVDNKPAYYARRGQRIAAEIQAMPKWANKAAIRQVYALSLRLTRATGIVHHVDHIVPLRGRNVCGLHVEYNLQVIPAKENLAKFNKFVG